MQWRRGVVESDTEPDEATQFLDEQGNKGKDYANSNRPGKVDWKVDPPSILVRSVHEVWFTLYRTGPLFYVIPLLIHFMKLTLTK